MPRILDASLRLWKLEPSSTATEELISRLRSRGLNVDTYGLLKMRGHGVIAEDRDSRQTSLTDIGATLPSLYKDSRFREYICLVGRRW